MASKRKPPVEQPATFVAPPSFSDPARPIAVEPHGAVEALLALSDGVVSAHTDGRIVFHAVRRGRLEVAREVMTLDPPAQALAFVSGRVVAASGTELVLVGEAARSSIDLGAPIAALSQSRRDVLHALAGDAVHTVALGGATIERVAETPIPLPRAHDLDVDAQGKLAVLAAHPGSVAVVALKDGKVLGRFGAPRYMSKQIVEVYSRFTADGKQLFVAYNRAHHVLRVSFKGTQAAELQQPSAWAGPLARSLDRRFVAARQSGIGVIVWSAANDEVAMFAELDRNTPDQDKFAKRARVEVAAVRATGPDTLKVTRWRSATEMGGSALAIAVAPDASYAVTGDREGRVTLVDGATRAITRSDGEALQAPYVVQTVTGPPEPWNVRVGRHLVLWPTTAGNARIVDLDTGESRDFSDPDPRPNVRIFGRSELVLVDDRRVRAFDLTTFEPLWTLEDPMPSCKHLAFDGVDVLGLEIVDSMERALHRMNPVTGARAPTLAISLAGADLRAEVTEHSSYDVTVRGSPTQLVLQGCSSQGSTTDFPLGRNGEVGPPLPDGATLLGDGEHALNHGLDWWTVSRVSDASVVAHAKVEGVTIGHVRADLRSRRVAALDMHTWRLHLFTLDGQPIAEIDGLGATREIHWTEDPATVWVLDRSGRALRLEVPAPR